MGGPHYYLIIKSCYFETRVHAEERRQCVTAMEDLAVLNFAFAKSLFPRDFFLPFC